MKSIIRFAVTPLFLAAYTVFASGSDFSDSIRPCVALTGTDSHVLERAWHRITNAEEWKSVWQNHRGRSSTEHLDPCGEPADLPLIDFDHYTVIAIFHGDGLNSAGLRVVETIEQSECLLFRYDDKSY